MAQGGSLLVSVDLVWVVLATCFCWPTYPSLSGAACWLDGLDGAAVVDCAGSTPRRIKGPGPGLVPLRTCPRSWGEGGVHSPRPPLSCWHITQGPPCPRRLFWGALGCPGLPSAFVVWVCAFRRRWCRCCCGVGVAVGVATFVAGAGGSLRDQNFFFVKDRP